MLKQAPNFSMDGNEKSHCINIYYIVIKKDITHFSDQTNILQIDEENIPEMLCFHFLIYYLKDFRVLLSLTVLRATDHIFGLIKI